MAVLRELAGGQEHPLHGKVTLIGRDPACDVVVRTDQTSFRHAMIVQTGGCYFIEDLESVNGVYVNGQRIRRARHCEPATASRFRALPRCCIRSSPPRRRRQA